MKYSALAAGAAAVGSASARVVTPNSHPELFQKAALDTAELIARGFPANAPDGYTPQFDDCPSDTPTIRSGGELSSNEQEWLQVRRNQTFGYMSDFLGRVNITGFDTNEYMDNNRNNASALPNIGIALSGGGYRAMLNGAGVVQAFDSRTDNSTNTGQLGGVLQSATYFAGLSGGSWLVSSLYANNFTSISDILQGTRGDEASNLWDFQNSVFEGPDSDSFQLFDSVGYYASVLNTVNDKSDAGFNITISKQFCPSSTPSLFFPFDLKSLNTQANSYRPTSGDAVYYQLINATEGGPAYTFSSIASQGWFQQGNAPLPLIVADGRAPGEVLISGNTTVYTFTPWELGSHDPTVYGFAPLKYVGTNFTEGSPRDESRCVTGFDNAGFVTGTSSSLFNQVLITVNEANATGLFTSALQDGIQEVLSAVGRADDDIADYPNPFYHYNNATNLNAQDRQLTLVDGGEDLQNIPLHPMIQPERAVDVIFAVDTSADTNESYPTSDSAPNWPDGASLVATYQRSLADIQNGTAFPAIPSSRTFFNLGLNTRPTFFGCDASNLTGPAPLIVYLPNAPYVYTSNVSTFDLDYNATERDAIILNGYNLATQGNGTLDEQWPTCVGCAILSRSLYRTGTEVPDVCSQCFDNYCWDGTIDDSEPGTYAPEFKLAEVSVEGGAERTIVGASAMVAAVVAAAVNLM